MTSPIQRRPRGPELDELYASDNTVRYAWDEVRLLSECPFPTTTPTFRVVEYGVWKREHDDGTFAIVEYRKKCDHLVWERIPFYENVTDFDHYGTKFYGADYKIANWERRIEFFRTILPCEVCQLVSHSLWIWTEGLCEENRTRKARLAHIEYLLESNYTNWREFVDLERLRAALMGKRNGFSYKDCSKWAIQRDP